MQRKGNQKVSVVYCGAPVREINKYIPDTIPLDKPKKNSASTAIHNMGAHLGLSTYDLGW